MRPVRGIAAAALILAVLMPAALPAADGATPAPVPAAPAITVVPVVLAEVSERVFASGLIAPVEEVAVAPQIEGQRIESLLVDAGDVVAAGQVLAELSDETLVLQRSQIEAQNLTALAAAAQAEAQLTDARASADEAVRVRDRTEALHREGTASQAALDQARAAAASALARVSATEQAVAAAAAQAEVTRLQVEDVMLRIERTRITAPVSGIVSARNAQLGAIASAAGRPMFVIIRDGALELQADLAERDVLRVVAGHEAAIRPVGLGQSLSGRVRLVDPSVDPLTRLGRVRIAIDDPSRVRSGLFAEAEILLAMRRGPVLPVTAVQSDRSGARVLRVDAGGVVEEVPVETGIRDGARIEILSGLAEGDTVVARAGAFVRPGDRITPVPLAD
ncbi:MAG: efflux RND transporter periplasmic adaptor subunit [Rubellimicrobium sp.]|nr:efflux RND transporter periplasmic adaptor subunit [Rubellimicrobium sp.]